MLVVFRLRNMNNRFIIRILYVLFFVFLFFTRWQFLLFWFVVVCTYHLWTSTRIQHTIRNLLTIILLIGTIYILLGTQQIQIPAYAGDLSSPSSITYFQSTSSFHDAFVTKVIDGDSIIIDSGEEIRYIGIDTAEIVSPNEKFQCFGDVARIYNEELVLGKTITIQQEISDTDTAGRSLRHVYVDNQLVSILLLEQGLARTYSVPPDIGLHLLFQHVEEIAKQRGRGVWGKDCF